MNARVFSNSIHLCSHFKKSEDDVSQFDSKFTKQPAIDSPVDSMLSESANMVFMVREIVLNKLKSIKAVNFIMMSLF